MLIPFNSRKVGSGWPSDQGCLLRRGQERGERLRFQGSLLSSTFSFLLVQLPHLGSGGGGGCSSGGLHTAWTLSVKLQDTCPDSKPQGSLADSGASFKELQGNVIFKTPGQLISQSFSGTPLVFSCTIYYVNSAENSVLAFGFCVRLNLRLRQA